MNSENEIISGDYLVDAETGEVLGLAEIKPAFIVDSKDAAEWVLERMSECDGEILALTARRDALVKNLNTQIDATRKKRDWLDLRFKGELCFWAGEVLAGAKQRFVQTAFGRVTFRKTPGSIKVADVVAALDWARKNAPDAVKVTESVVVTPLKGREAELPEGVFEVMAPGESFKVETGVLA